MSRVTLSGPAVRVLAAFAAVGVFVLVLYAMAGLPKPSEENRFRTANNSFSIIAPPEWEPIIRYGANDKTFHTTMDIQPKKSVGPAQKMFIGVYRNPPDLQKLKSSLNYRDYTFQGKPALVWSGKNKNDHVWEMVFERDQTWFNLTLRLNLEEDIPSSGWWPYLNTFQANAVKPSSTASTTQMSVMD
jgi:hypothetical protein